MTKSLDIIDAILERAIFSQPERKSAGTRNHLSHSDLRYFSPAFALVPKDDEEDSLWFIPPEDFDRPDIIWPLDVSVCKWSDADGKLEFYRAQSRKPSFFRNRPCRVFPYMATLDVARVGDSVMTASCAVGWANKKWVDAETGRLIYSNARTERMERVGTDIDEARKIDDSLKMSVSVALTLRYKWCVSFGIDDSPRIKLETDPTGLKELFRDREKEPDKNRRAALKNWVRDHWRRSRIDEGDEVYVRQHLRGAIPFKWRGLDCTVEPAPFDIELNEKLKMARRA